MKLKQVIRGAKSRPEVGPWHTGHVNRSDFPLSKAKAKNYRFGPEYSWRVAKFTCAGESFRLLILFNSGKMIYRATLGIEQDKDLVILCHHEYHASEPGWHCHLTLDDHTKAPKGWFRRGMRRWPAAKAKHMRVDFNVSQPKCVDVAATRFRLAVQGDLL